MHTHRCTTSKASTHLPLVHQGLRPLVGVHAALHRFQELLAGGVVLLAEVDELRADGVVVGLELVVLAAKGLGGSGVIGWHT